jgi:arylformamidase
MTLRTPDEHGSLIDISVMVSASTPEWPGDTPYSCRWTWEVARGDSVNVSSIAGSPHVGTHADAPFHVDAGWATADALPLASFTGPATVVDVSRLEGALTVQSLGLAGGVAGGRLLLHTGQSIAAGAFPESWPWVAEDAIRELVTGGLRLLGVDRHRWTPGQQVPRRASRAVSGRGLRARKP